MLPTHFTNLVSLQLKCSTSTVPPIIKGKQQGVRPSGCLRILLALYGHSEVKSLSRVWLFATPWTAANQASPSMGFSRQEYWSGVPWPYLWLIICIFYSVFPLEKEMATHSSTLAWKIPWMKEPGRLQSKESQRVRHDWATLPHPTSCMYIHIHPYTHTTSSLTIHLLMNAWVAPKFGYYK